MTSSKKIKKSVPKKAAYLEYATGNFGGRDPREWSTEEHQVIRVAIKREAIDAVIENEHGAGACIICGTNSFAVYEDYRTVMSEVFG